MPTKPLPDRPDLEQLRTRARELQRAVAAGDADAIALVAEHHPSPLAGTLPLAAAQLVVARSHGFASWARLKAHVETIRALTRSPHALGEQADPGDELLRLACLTYGDDDPARRRRARELAERTPGLASRSLHVAAALADVGAVRAHLDDGADPNAHGGPQAWPPLLHLAYARGLTDDRPDDVVAVLDLLLEAGADPNAGFLWDGFPSPFTALTGLFGQGEGGPVAQPEHPQCELLVRRLLHAGADPNDAQALYNRIFVPGTRHLELLLEHGAGTGDGGPWRRRLGDLLDPPEVLLRGQLHWAITHGMVDRVQLLAGHGVDLTSPFTDLREVYHHDLRTPAQLAAANGQQEILGILLEHGATPPDLAPADALVGALLAGDRAAVDALEREHPGTVASVRADRGWVIVWAAANGLAGAVRLLLDLGFDVDARGRHDNPIASDWETALHAAAARGHVDVLRTLLAAGADATARDARFHATALGFAHHEGHPEAVALLDPVTPDEG